MTSNQFDIVVAGAGPAGSVAAIMLAEAGWRVALVGPRAARDHRTTALMMPAIDILDRLDLGARIRAAAAPLKTMRIVDGSDRLFRAPPVSFQASEIEEEQFGFNVPNADLNAVLSEAVASRPAVVRIAEPAAEWALAEDDVAATTGGRTVRALLAVAADGRASPAREAAGIRMTTRSLRQSALVLTFAHTRPHGSVSTEFHTTAGPFTQVPLPGDRSSLVWVMRPEDAKAMSAWDDSVLSRAVEDQMQSMLGRVTVEPGRQVFALSLARPDRYAAKRVALVGEAAHVIPPIGAQGLNLGFRDIATLVDAIADHRDDPGSDDALTAYQRARRPDIAARTIGVDLLNRSLLIDFLPVQLARGLGLGLLGALPPLRALLMREGMRPGSGFRALFGGSGEQVGRQ